MHTFHCVLQCDCVLQRDSVLQCDSVWQRACVRVMNVMVTRQCTLLVFCVSLGWLWRRWSCEETTQVVGAHWSIVGRRTSDVRRPQWTSALQLTTVCCTATSPVRCTAPISVCVIASIPACVTAHYTTVSVFHTRSAYFSALATHSTKVNFFIVWTVYYSSVYCFQ